MSEEERMEPTPEETGNPNTPPSPPSEDISVPAEAASAEATAETTAEVSAAPTAEPPVEAPAPVYRWTYADQKAHEAEVASAKNRKGILIYALVMTGVFLVSFGLLIATLLGGNGWFSGLGPLRPGITADDDEAVVGVEQAKHSVVVIETRTEKGGGTGTGIIMTADGYIATNHHVIDDATAIQVTFYDGTVMSAEVIGSSEMDDLGVIKVKASGLPVATFADSDNCYVGQTVYAIGTPAGPSFGWTTTKGIISYKNREVKLYADDGTLRKKLRLLQTDANVNPGNSGGPLVNTNGEVVGVVSMRMADGFEGIGFAIPSDGAVEILEAIIKYGNADSINSSLSHKRPMIGITTVYVIGDCHYYMSEKGIEQILITDLDEFDEADLIHPEVSGVYVASITKNTDAVGKLQVGDIITAIQGTELTSRNHMMSLINQHYEGDTLNLTVYRNGEYISVDIVLSAQTSS